MAVATKENHPEFSNLKEKWRIRRLKDKIRCEYISVSSTVISSVSTNKTERSFVDCVSFLSVLGAGLSESHNYDILSFPNALLDVIEMDKLKVWAAKANLTIETNPLRILKNA